MTATPRPPSASFRYAAFISYRRDADIGTASALQAGLRKIARPWYRRASLRVCRDKTDVVLNPALWPALKERLDASEHLILLASPEAAASPWIGREVAEWVTSRSVESVLIVLTAGEIVWDPATGDFDPRTTALPSALHGRYRDEPAYLDLRFARATPALSLKHGAFRDAVAELAARLQHREKSEVLGDDLREQRRLLRLAWSAAAALLMLAAATTVAAVFAVRQRDAATRERTLAVARQLVAQSQLSNRESPALGVLSALLALEAARRAPSTQSDQALRLATSMLPPLHAALPHGAPVSAVAFSPDGTKVATVSGNGGVVWDLPTRREISRVRHDQTLTSIAFSPDSTQVVTASNDGTAAVWVAGTGALVARVQHDLMEELPVDRQTADGRPIHGDPIRGPVAVATVSQDGRWLATASDDRTARVWELPGGREIFRARHDDYVTALAFSPDARRLVTGSDDNTARLWDVPSGRELNRVAHDDRVSSVAFSPDGRLVASASIDATVRLWSLEREREPRVLRHDKSVASVAFSADRPLIATASRDGTARVWEVESGRELFRAVHADPVTHVAFGPGARLLVTSDGTGRLWSVDARTEVARFRHEVAINDIALSPDGSSIATVADDGALRVWAASGGGERLRLETARGGRPARVAAMTFNADESLVVTMGQSNDGARVWDVASGKELMRAAPRGTIGVGAALGPGDALILTERDRVSTWDARSGRQTAQLSMEGVDFGTVPNRSAPAVSFTTDGRRMAKILSDALYVWDIERERTSLRMTLPAPVVNLAFSPGGRYLAIARPGPDQARSRTIEIWDVDTRTRVIGILHPDPVRWMALSPDARSMATPGEFATGGAVLRVWTTATSEVVYERPFEESIIGAVFDPSGRYVAVGTRDGAAVVVDVQAGTELLRVRHDELSSIGFSPTGRFLTTTGNDGTARAWFWQRTDIVADACARVTRNLTWAEWRDYLPADEPYNKTCSSLPVHPSVLEAARTLARKGDTAAATAIFERAVELEPALGFVPADEAKRWTTAAGGGGKR